MGDMLAVSSANQTLCSGRLEITGQWNKASRVGGVHGLVRVGGVHVLVSDCHR